MRRKGVLILLALLSLGAAFGIGVFVGVSDPSSAEFVRGILHQQNPQEFAQVDLEPFWRAWNLIETKYVAAEDINRQNLVWGAIQGLAGAVGDPYTVFFPPQEKKYFESEVNGEFEGIGAEIGLRNNNLVIISPLEGSPAKAAGLKAGDTVLKIDDFETIGITLDKAVNRIRGEKGTTVVLTVTREENKKESIMEIAITRDKINVPIIQTDQDAENGIFTIKLFSFSSNSPREFEKAIREFSASGSDKLILDLRNNPGGFLDAAVDIASWFIPEGEIIAREEFRDRDPIEYRSRGYAQAHGLKMVVLADRGSASASEILAGALQEHGVATIIGEKTFGKGSVQELVEVTSDTSLKITIARWLTPSGKSISQNGLDPDILVTEIEQEQETEDPFMEKAKTFLLK